MTALDDDDDTNLARFLNKQHGSWHEHDDVGSEYGELELDGDMASGMQLASDSTFVPLPAHYHSRLGTPEAPQQPSTRQQTQRHTQRQQAQTALDSPPTIVALPLQPLPPPLPPVERPSPADERPLPALTKRSRHGSTAPTQREPQLEADKPAVEADEEELYADEEFVVEEAQVSDDGDERYEEDEMVAETEEQPVVEEAVEDDIQQPSEYSKLVSDVDVKNDYLDQFVIGETDVQPGTTHRTARKPTSGKKWSTTAAVQAAA